MHNTYSKGQYINAGGISEGPRVTRKGSSKRQHVTLTRSEHPPVTVPTLGFTGTVLCRLLV